MKTYVIDTTINKKRYVFSFEAKLRSWVALLADITLVVYACAVGNLTGLLLLAFPFTWFVLHVKSTPSFSYVRSVLHGVLSIPMFLWIILAPDSFVILKYLVGLIAVCSAVLCPLFFVVDKLGEDLSVMKHKKKEEDQQRRDDIDKMFK